jgi:uncharacterized membrane protein YhiD involved in acid resistance
MKSSGTIRKLVAATAIAGVATLGVGVGVAGASTGAAASVTTAASSPSVKHCVATLARLERQKSELEGKIDVLQRERNDALSHHRDRLAARLEVRIVKLQARKAALEAKIDAVRARCH